MRELIEQLFDARIKAKCTEAEKKGLHPDVRAFLLQHERKQLCLDRLTSEVIQCELSLATKFKRKSLEAVVASIADLFMSNALKAHAEGRLSNTERLRQMAEATRMDDLEKELQEEVKDEETMSRKPRIYLP